MVPTAAAEARQLVPVAACTPRGCHPPGCKSSRWRGHAAPGYVRAHRCLRAIWRVRRREAAGREARKEALIKSVAMLKTVGSLYSMAGLAQRYCR
mmetsp:Transcript_125715/g.350231  ORF Transcript_125715/g.350231 Transcript_125715/m.350231 type:complete len:95 (+) Transcript_125715:761-1045(+)